MLVQNGKRTYRSRLIIPEFSGDLSPVYTHEGNGGVLYETVQTTDYGARPATQHVDIFPERYSQRIDQCWRSRGNQNRGMIYSHSMEQDLTFAVQLAQQVGERLIQKFKQDGLKTRIKADHSLVTEADIAADQMIADAVQQQYPGDVLLSEELAPIYHAPASVDQSAAGKSAHENVWVVDPIDGTTNFSKGLHVWGVLIARMRDGWPELGVLYFPLLKELYTAQRDAGAFLNGHPIHADPAGHDTEESFFACCSRTFRRYKVSVPYKPRILGSTAYSLCCVARGAALLAFEATPKIWDIAAGWLLVHEAGGVIETLDGSAPFPIRYEVNYARESFPTLAGASSELTQKARSQIVPIR